MEETNRLINASDVTSVWWDAFLVAKRDGQLIKYENDQTRNPHYRIKGINGEPGKYVLQIKIKEVYRYYSKYCFENKLTALPISNIIEILTAKGYKWFYPQIQPSREGRVYRDAKFGTCYQFRLNSLGGDEWELDNITFNSEYSEYSE